MRCVAYTTAENYNLKETANLLATGLPQTTELVNYGEAQSFKFSGGNVFVFVYGCFVAWNLEPQSERELIDFFRKISKEPFDPLFEEFEYKMGKKVSVLQDVITLKDGKDIIQQMLAVSYGLSQSIKLSRFEDRVLTQINDSKSIPQELSQRGRISLSRREISKRIGSLFIERNSINLHSDILDVPGYFWDHPEYEELYSLAISDQDLKARTIVLNTRLDIVRELFQVLNDQLNIRHSTLLEWIIILLIFLEVVLSVSLHLVP